MQEGRKTVPYTYVCQPVPSYQGGVTGKLDFGILDGGCQLCCGLLLGVRVLRQ